MERSKLLYGSFGDLNDNGSIDSNHLDASNLSIIDEKENITVGETVGMDMEFEGEFVHEFFIYFNTKYKVSKLLQLSDKDFDRLLEKEIEGFKDLYMKSSPDKEWGKDDVQTVKILLKKFKDQKIIGRGFGAVDLTEELDSLPRPKFPKRKAHAPFKYKDNIPQNDNIVDLTRHSTNDSKTQNPNIEPRKEEVSALADSSESSNAVEIIVPDHLMVVEPAAIVSQSGPLERFNGEFLPREPLSNLESEQLDRLTDTLFGKEEMENDIEPSKLTDQVIKKGYGRINLSRGDLPEDNVSNSYAKVPVQILNAKGPLPKGLYTIDLSSQHKKNTQGEFIDEEVVPMVSSEVLPAAEIPKETIEKIWGLTYKDLEHVLFNHIKNAPQRELALLFSPAEVQDLTEEGEARVTELETELEKIPEKHVAKRQKIKDSITKNNEIIRNLRSIANVDEHQEQLMKTETISMQVKKLGDFLIDCILENDTEPIKKVISFLRLVMESPANNSFEAAQEVLEVARAIENFMRSQGRNDKADQINKLMGQLDISSRK